MTGPTGPPADDLDRPLVDPEALERFLDARLPGAGRVSVERHQAGHSNETFFVDRGQDRWVLRRPPRGAFLPTAHDVLREHRVLAALASTDARAPRPVIACDDETVIGAPFYLMERIDGVVIRDSLPDALSSDDDRRRIGEELVDALAELHAVDFRAVGLEGWGKPEGYLARQVRRWRGQLALATQFSRPLPTLEAVGEWLDANVPPADDQRGAIVHGDYKLDNVAFAPGSPARLVAILDWEMSTLGDPLADLGWMLSFWVEADDPASVSLERGTVTRLPGFAPRADLLDRYREQTGRSMADLRFSTVLALFKLATLLEGSYARHLAGVTDDPFFAELEEGVPGIAARARELIG
jgi:aminoglycoside phosphotransferase (APT) family kinase protein